MKSLFSPMLVCAAMVASLMAMPTRSAVAQSETINQAAIVISIGNIEEQLKDAGYMSEAAGFGRIGAIMINSQADEYLKGIDRKRPIAVYVHIDEDNPSEPTVVAMVPISDYEEMLDQISTFGDLDEGDVDVLSTPGAEIFFKESGQYAVVASTEEAIEWAPKDPSKDLGDMPKKYNVAVKVFGQLIPESLRNEAIEAMREGYAQELGDDELQQQSADLQMEQMESLINETKEVMFGFEADQEGKKLVMDFAMVGLKGSKIAKLSAEQAKAKASRFAGFLMKSDDVMMNMNSSSRMTSEDSQTYTGLLDSFADKMKGEMEGKVSEEQSEAAGELIDNLIKVAKDTMAEGNSDAGMVMMGGDAPSMAMAFEAVDPARIETSLKKLAEAFEGTAGISAEINSGKMGSANLHTIAVQIPAGEEEMQTLFGDTLEFVVGVDDKTFYMAAGNDPEALLKKAVNASGSKEAKPGEMELNLFLAPILELTGQLEDQGIVESMAEILRESGGDRITGTSGIIKDGMTGRLEIQDGILKLISVGAENFGMGF